MYYWARKLHGAAIYERLHESRSDVVSRRTHRCRATSLDKIDRLRDLHTVQYWQILRESDSSSEIMEDTMSTTVTEMFNSFQDSLNNEQEVREVCIDAFLENGLLGYVILCTPDRFLSLLFRNPSHFN